MIRMKAYHCVTAVGDDKAIAEIAQIRGTPANGCDMAIIPQQAHHAGAMALDVIGLVQDHAQLLGAICGEQAGQTVRAGARFESGFLEVGVEDSQFALRQVDYRGDRLAVILVGVEARLEGPDVHHVSRATRKKPWQYHSYIRRRAASFNAARVGRARLSARARRALRSGAGT